MVAAPMIIYYTIGNREIELRIDVCLSACTPLLRYNHLSIDIAIGTTALTATAAAASVVNV